MSSILETPPYLQIDILTSFESIMCFRIADLFSLLYMIHLSDANNSSSRYSVPVCSGNGTQRNGAIVAKQAGYLYGPSLMGNTSYFPTGSLGDAMVQRDVAQWDLDYSNMGKLATDDVGAAYQAIAAVSAVSIETKKY